LLYDQNDNVGHHTFQEMHIFLSSVPCWCVFLRILHALGFWFQAREKFHIPLATISSVDQLAVNRHNVLLADFDIVYKKKIKTPLEMEIARSFVIDRRRL